jgi:outer membrane protein TolC
MRTLVAGGSVVIVGMWLSWGHAARAEPPAPPGPVPTPEGGALVPPSAGSTQLGPDMGTERAPKELLEVHPGGLTAEQVGARASATSWNAKASEENLRGAAARVDEAWAAFLPRLSGIGKYTRLSPISAPDLGTLVVATGPAFAGNGPFDVTPGTAFPGPPNKLQAVGLTFPILVDNWLFEGTITVPISDYLLRIDQNYSAATHSQDAAQWDVISARAAAGSNGKMAYYTWLRARGAVVVAALALEDQRTHYRDAQNQFAVGNASKADVLRAETAVASAELALDRAKNLADLSEKQVRVAIHAGEDDALAPGEDLEGTLPPVQGDVKQWTAEALRDRPEIKSANANAAAARKQAGVAEASRYPVLSGFADGLVANPNPRIFPQTNTWFPSWDIGAQVTWSPNDVLTAGGAIADAESRVAAVEANRNNVRDGIDVEVTQAWQAVQEADFSAGTSARELTSAQEAYRVARELFNNGRGTSTTLTDAETDLTRARLDLLNAKADARIGRIRLDHALGRDATTR